MEVSLTENQLEGIKKMIAFKHDFTYSNLHWLNEANIVLDNSNVRYANIIDTFINTFCSYELADNNYVSIHLEASQYSHNKNLFEHSGIEKLLKHLTYIIWTDKLVDGYLPARIKDQTIYNILQRLEELEELVLTPAT